MIIFKNRKRIFDLSVVFLLAPLSFLLCMFAALAITLECFHSPFFFQVRLGRDETAFRLLKLRTMRPSTSELASHLVGSQNILVVGRLLRILKIDELPQLWNVLKGDMSIVGPRPSLISQTELIEERRKFNIYDMLPGITGVSQIAGIDMSTPARLAAYDAAYLGKWSACVDLKILLATVTGSGRGDAAGARRSFRK